MVSLANNDQCNLWVDFQLSTSSWRVVMWLIIYPRSDRVCKLWPTLNKRKLCGDIYGLFENE